MTYEKTQVKLQSQVEKVLGTVWLPQEDMFTFKIKRELAKENLPFGDPGTFIPLKPTKRLILSKLASVFDPIGAGAAVLVKPKIAMQKLWQIGLGWDDELPPEIKRKRMTLFEEMIALNNVRLKRCLTPPNACGDPSLIVFSDASRQALGACAYVQWKLKDGRFGVRFAAAKCRVAPLKELTIPCLELQAAVLASRLGSNIVEKSRFKFERIRYFSESLVTLSWIRSESRSFKPLLSCRVGEIQSKTKPADWFHCPTMLNVADDLTKGILVEAMNGRWFNGRKFLQQGEEF